MIAYFNSISYKKKNKILIYSLPVLVLIIYYLAIHNTILAFRKNYELKQQTENAGKSTDTVNELELRINKLNNKLGISDTVNTDNREYVMNKISDYCKTYSLQLINYPQSSYSTFNDYTIQSKTIEITGNFMNITKLVYSIEQELFLGRVASLQYYTKKNSASRKSYLVAKIIIQNIKKSDNE